MEELADQFKKALGRIEISGKKRERAIAAHTEVRAVLEGSDVSEHTLTEIYRISPADGIQRSLDKKKLAGTTLMDFGSFLKREWRENDILWGINEFFHVGGQGI